MADFRVYGFPDGSLLGLGLYNRIRKLKVATGIPDGGALHLRRVGVLVPATASSRIVCCEEEGAELMFKI